MKQKQEYTNPQVIEMWADKKLERASANTLLFIGSTLYSYSHPIAAHTNHKAVFVDMRFFSRTTESHQRDVLLSVSPDFEVFKYNNIPKGLVSVIPLISDKPYQILPITIWQQKSDIIAELKTRSGQKHYRNETKELKALAQEYESEIIGLEYYINAKNESRNFSA